MTTNRITVYEDEGGEWRWRLDLGNGKKFAVSGESFDDEWNADRAAERVEALLKGSDVDEPVVIVKAGRPTELEGRAGSSS